MQDECLGQVVKDGSVHGINPGESLSVGANDELERRHARKVIADMRSVTIVSKDSIVNLCTTRLSNVEERHLVPCRC